MRRQFYGMKRANGDWFAPEVGGQNRVPVFRTNAGAWRARARNPELMLFRPAPVDEKALEELATADDGRLTDSQGRVVDFKNTVVIMTSNIGSQSILEHRGRADTEAYELMKESVLAELRRHISVELTDEAATRLAREGYDPVYGARPLKRAIQKELETPIGRRILRGEIGDGQAALVDWRDGAFTFAARDSVLSGASA